MNLHLSLYSRVKLDEASDLGVILPGTENSFAGWLATLLGTAA